VNRRVEVALYAVSALLLAGTAGIWWRGVRPSPIPQTSIVQPSGTAEETGGPAPSGAEDEHATIFVHLAGAVQRPGVYRFNEGQRLYEALELVGLSEAADISALNLASPLRDSQKIYVPKVGEIDPPVAADPVHPPGPSGGSGSSGAAPVTFPLDVNSASQSELEELPGIGPVLARAIIARREEVGPFERAEDLQDVPGIGAKIFAKIAPFVEAK
jgi:competence protein ComEA